MDNISWTITPTERRKQIQKFIVRSWYLFFVIAISSSFLYTSNYSNLSFSGVTDTFKNIASTIIGISLGIAILLLVNKLIIRKDRKYFLDDRGVGISLGKKSELFVWEDFDFFYNYSSRNSKQHSNQPNNSLQTSKTELDSIEKGIEGDIFYLRQKSKAFLFFGQVFVVIRTKPENSILVEQFLASKLKQAEMTNTSDLGMVLYKFK